MSLDDHAEIGVLPSSAKHTNRFRDHNRARLLAEIEDFPLNALIGARHAAAFLDTSPGQLANWRMQRRGPPFMRGRARFVRYRISDLKAFVQEQFKATEP